MFKIYLTEAIKNMKAKLTLSVIIVLLFTFLLQILSYSLAWVTYNFWNKEVYNTGITTEGYLEYSVYVIASHSENPAALILDLFRSESKLDQETGRVVKTPLTEEDIAWNDWVIESYFELKEKLQNIDGYFMIGTGGSITTLFSNDGRAYELSNQKSNQSIDRYIEQYLESGYTEEEISQFCYYNAIRFSKKAILLQGFTYCEGEGFTEENLDYEYIMTEDGTLPTVPIVMGYDFKKYFEVGDIITNPDGLSYIKNRDKVTPSQDQYKGSFVVVGFLEKGSYAELNIGNKENVDDYIIIPTVGYNAQNFPSISDMNQAKAYQSLVNKQIVYVEKENEAQTVEAITKALEEDPVYEALGIEPFMSKSDQITKVYEQIVEKRMINYGMISGSTLIFCVAVIILIIVNKFNNNTKDTAIHRLVGATVADSVKAYVLEFAIYLICADILLHYVYIIYAINPMSSALTGFWMSILIGGVEVRLMYPLMLVMNIFFLVIVAIASYVCSARLNTAITIKGKE